SGARHFRKPGGSRAAVDLPEVAQVQSLEHAAEATPGEAGCVGQMNTGGATFRPQEPDVADVCDDEFSTADQLHIEGVLSAAGPGMIHHRRTTCHCPAEHMLQAIARFRETRKRERLGEVVEGT